MNNKEKPPSNESLLTESTRKILFTGSLTFLTITAAALLHVNQPEFILDRFAGISNLEYSLFDVMLYAAYLVFGIITGALSDRWSRRRIFVIVGASGSIVFYLLMTTTLSYPLLLAYRFLQGSFTVMAWQSFMTLALDFSSAQSRGKHMGIFGALLALSFGFGPAIGGVLATIGVFAPYYMAAGLNVLVLLLAIAGLRDPSTTKKRPSIVQSLLVARRYPKLTIPITFNFVDRLHMGFILVALPLFLTSVLGLPESLRGMALAIFATPFIILQYPMGKLSDKFGRYPILVAGSIPYSIVLAALGFIGGIGFLPLLLGLVLLGIFSGITAPSALALVGDTSDAEDSAMAMGLFNFSGNVGVTVGPLIFGYFIFISDFFTTFIVAGAIEVISLAVVILIIKVVFKETLRPRRKELEVQSTVTQ
ncbi:MAG: MFS transporter [Candidatus Thorarchaeota archaeon]